jgi:hypothetical protein
MYYQVEPENSRTASGEVAEEVHGGPPATYFQRQHPLDVCTSIIHLTNQMIQLLIQ